MIRVKNLRVPYDDARPLKEIAAKRLKISPCAVHGVIVVHKALDARRRNGAPIVWNYTIDVDAADEKDVRARARRDSDIAPAEREEPLAIRIAGRERTARTVPLSLVSARQASSRHGRSHVRALRRLFWSAGRMLTGARRTLRVFGRRAYLTRRPTCSSARAGRVRSRTES